MLIEKINKIKSNTDYNKDEINSIIEEADSPEKEVLFIYSNFGKFYSINKDNFYIAEIQTYNSTKMHFRFNV